ncbi:ribonuclease III domain-containing protein [Pisolithus albus]|nr:ribonuclease III domain-containing protein [Pisolithus albus]
MSYHSPSHRSDGLSLVVEEEGLGEEYVVPGSFPWSSSPAPSLVSPSLTSSPSHTLLPASPTLSMGSSGTVSLAAEGPSLATLRDSLLEQREQIIVPSDSHAATNRMRIRHGGEVPQDITEIREHLHTIETRLEILLNRQREIEKESITDRRHENTSDWTTRAEVESVSESSTSTDLESLRRRWSDLARGARIHAPAAQPAEPFSEFLGIPSPPGITGVQSPPPIMPFFIVSRDVRRVYTALRPEGRLLDVDAIRTRTAPVGSIIPQGACRRTHFSEGVYRAFLFLPRLCRRATDVYRAREARFQLGLPPIADDLLIESTALPTTNANWNLETLGDSVLKLITTVRITNKCPHRHEGQLSQLRQSSMSNRALLARATEIERFLTSEGQNVHVWRYTVPEGEDVLSHMLNSYHAVQRSFPRRSLQDCMEATLGAAFLTGGIELNIVP